jgi:hypothetical protein
MIREEVDGKIFCDESAKEMYKTNVQPSSDIMLIQCVVSWLKVAGLDANAIFLFFAIFSWKIRYFVKELTVFPE